MILSRRILKLLMLTFMGFSFLCAQSNQPEPKAVIPLYKGQKHRVFHNTIKGYDFIDYTFEAKAGEEVEISLKTNNFSNYFNVSHEKNDTALFVGSTLGNHYKAILPEHGVYIIRVYLMRNAARRGERARYDLEVKRSESIAPQVIDPLLGPRYYDASGTILCSFNELSLQERCKFKVIRTLESSRADVWIKPIHALEQEGAYRLVHFESKRFRTDLNTTISQERKEDNWLIDLNQKEFYFIPDALLYGG